MKVLQVGKFYDPYSGGMETVLKNLCQGLKSRVEIQVLVANTSFTTSHENLGFPITRAASLGNFFSTSICPSFPYWLKEINADIIHIHIPNPLAELSYLISGINRKLVIHFHSNIVRQKYLVSFYNPLLKKFYERADRIIVATPKHLEFSPFLSIFHKKCRVVPFGIVLEEYELNNEKTKAIQELNREVPIILFVGRLVYYKGIDILIRSMTDIQAKLLIIGTGPLESALKKLTLQLNLDKKVIFLGPVKYEDLVFYYHACDFLVLPSVANSEMFGMVQIEAMACRKPVISTNLPTGVSWVNQNGITGLLVTPGNVSALAQAIRKLIENPALRQEMGEAGRKRVEENFTREKMVQGVLDVYREISC